MCGHTNSMTFTEFSIEAIYEYFLKTNLGAIFQSTIFIIKQMCMLSNNKCIIKINQKSKFLFLHFSALYIIVTRNTPFVYFWGLLYVYDYSLRDNEFSWCLHFGFGVVLCAPTLNTVHVHELTCTGCSIITFS